VARFVPDGPNRASPDLSEQSPLDYSFAVCTGSAESGQFLFVWLK